MPSPFPGMDPYLEGELWTTFHALFVPEIVGLLTPLLRRRFLESTAHLLEIDLLRHGQRLPMQEPLPPVAYFAFLNRVDNRPVTGVWPIALDQPLPKVPIPLLATDSDVVLNLQTAFFLS